jgi:hypothetical protein
VRRGPLLTNLQLAELEPSSLVASIESPFHANNIIVNHTSDGSGVAVDYMWIVYSEPTGEEQLCLYDIQCHTNYYADFVLPKSLSKGTLDTTNNQLYGARAEYQCGRARGFDFEGWNEATSGPLPPLLSVSCGDDGQWIYDQPVEVKDQIWDEANAKPMPASKCKCDTVSTTSRLT